MKKDECMFKLDSCVWEITLACCFSCKYCGSKAGKARNNELTTDECIDVANQLADMKCRRVSMIGGEVFMRKDWDVIVETLIKRNVIVSIITNGFIFTDDIIKRLKALDIESVAISLDGPEDVHDKYRQVGSFKRALNAIDVLSSNNIPVSVISTLHSENVERLYEMYEVLENTNIFAWQLQACSPMGNAAKNELSTNIDGMKVIDFVEQINPKSSFDIGVADNIGFYTCKGGEIRINGGRSNFNGCSAGLSAIGIDSVGNVRGCESLYDEKFIEGNLRERSLKDIWEDPNAFAYNRQFTLDKLSGKCKECPHGSQCAGGCRSHNFFSHGKLYESTLCAR